MKQQNFIYQHDNVAVTASAL